jgi:hypothetical protein
MLPSPGVRAQANLYRSPVALVTRGESDFAVVTGEALSIAAMVSNGNQPLFLGLKQLCACRW